MSVIHEVDVMYAQLKDKINRDNDVYNTEKFPKLLEILEKYDKDSPGHALYQNESTTIWCSIWSICPTAQNASRAPKPNR